MSPQGSLRAPLLWLLLPFMAGLCLAAQISSAESPARGLLSGLLLVAGGACLVGLRGNSEARWRTEGSLIAAALLAGYAWFGLRAAPGAGWEHPARELEVELAVEQVFPSTDQRKTLSGLARIVHGSGPAAELAGQRVYFAAIKRVSVTPAVSGHYRFRGVVENVPRGAGARGFDRYLDGLGVRVRLGRGQVIAETRGPTRFQRFCTTAQARLERILRRGLEDRPELGSLYAAMLLGEKALLNAEQESAFMRTGVFHIFSISGLHVGVIAVAILSGLVLLRIPPRAARVVGLAVLWLYVQITGGSTPAERAFLMIAFFVSMKVLRLPGNPLASLAAAAFVTLLADPRQLFTTGFQMSYSVVTALIVLGAPLAERWQRAWKPWEFLPESGWARWQHFVRWSGRGLLAAVAITWSATVASTPSSIGNFGLFSPGALLANLAIVPLASLAIVAGFVALLAGLLWLDPVVVLMNHAAGLTILVMDRLVVAADALPGMAFAASFREPWMGPASLVVVLGSMLLSANRRLGRTAPYWLPVAALAATMILGVKFS